MLYFKHLDGALLMEASCLSTNDKNSLGDRCFKRKDKVRPFDVMRLFSADELILFIVVAIGAAV